VHPPDVRHFFEILFAALSEERQVFWLHVFNQGLYRKRDGQDDR
jgi:hypothetical protein